MAWRIGESGRSVGGCGWVWRWRLDPCRECIEDRHQR